MQRGTGISSLCNVRSVLDWTGSGGGAILKRHQAGDWGELDDEDRKANQDALIHGLRVMSVYRVLGVRMWVIAEANRSSTMIP